MSKSKCRTVGLLIGLALLLAGCMGEMSLTVDFYREGEWEAVTEVSVPQEAVAIAGGGDKIEADLDDMVQEVREEDVRASWNKQENDGRLTYVVNMRGTDLDSLSSTVLEDAEIVVDEDSGARVIHVSYYPGLPGFESQTLVLRGGEIIAGNGQRVDRQTMMWENPVYLVEASLREHSRFPLGKLLGVGTGIVTAVGILAGAAYLWRRNKPAKPAYCPWCGAQMSGGARFCTQCGRSRDG